MNASVLTTIKKMLGIAEDYDAFDVDILVFINSAFLVLRQLGIPMLLNRISGANETWNDVFGDRTDLDTIKEVVYLRVRRMFDPPSSSAVDGAMMEQIKELEWRLNFVVDGGGIG